MKIITEKFHNNKSGNWKLFFKLEVLLSLNQQLWNFQENTSHRKNPPKKNWNIEQLKRNSLVKRIPRKTLMKRNLLKLVKKIFLVVRSKTDVFRMKCKKLYGNENYYEHKKYITQKKHTKSKRTENSRNVFWIKV